jgi:tetratricopeptide (TPR) repeat protein
MRSQSLPTLSLLLSVAVLLVTNTTQAQQAGLFGSESADLPSSTSAAGNTAQAAPNPVAKHDVEPATPTISKATTTIQLGYAVEALTNLLDQNRQSKNRQAEAHTLGALATAYGELRQQQKAVETFQAALAIWKELGNNAAEASTLAHIGDTYRDWGFPQQSLPYYRDALKLYPTTNQKTEEAAVINNLGLAYFGLHDRKKCLTNFNQALDSYRAMHDRQGEASTLTNIASAYSFLVHDQHKAIDYFQQAITTLELLDNKSQEANALELMGIVWMKLDKPDTAVQTFQRALFLYSRIGDARGKASVLKYLKSAGGETIASASTY